MSKAVAVPYIIAILLGVAVMGLIGYWLFVSGGKFSGESLSLECNNQKLIFCKGGVWDTRCGDQPDCTKLFGISRGESTSEPKESIKIEIQNVQFVPEQESLPITGGAVIPPWKEKELMGDLTDNLEFTIKLVPFPKYSYYILLQYRLSETGEWKNAVGPIDVQLLPRDKDTVKLRTDLKSFIPTLGKFEFQITGGRNVMEVIESESDSKPKVNVQKIGSGDLDIIYVERTPKYPRYRVTYFSNRAACDPENSDYYPYPEDRGPQLCPGEEKLRRYDRIGDTITFVAHIQNKGDLPIKKFRYTWFIDDNKVSSGEITTSLAQSSTTTIGLPLTLSELEPTRIKIMGETEEGPYPLSELEPEKIKIIIETDESELTKINNWREVYFQAIPFRIFVAQEIYEEFESTLNFNTSFSFEDWIYHQFAVLNRKFEESGIKERVRIDFFEITPPNKRVNIHDPFDPANVKINYLGQTIIIKLDDLYNYAHWSFGGIHPDFAKNVLKKPEPFTEEDYKLSAKCYFIRFATIDVPSTDPCKSNGLGIDPGLLHELVHQLGIAHSGDADIQKAKNFINNVKLGQRNLDIIMKSGDELSRPFEENLPFVPYIVFALNSNYGKLRGYYGDYLFDVPDKNILKFRDIEGNPLSNAIVEIWQSKGKGVAGEPIFRGVTDANGEYVLPNQQLHFTTTTETGHTLKSNPFGNINVIGANGLLLIKISFGNQEDYKILTVHDFNLKYWRGDKDEVVYEFTAKIVARESDETNLALDKVSYASSSWSDKEYYHQYANDGDIFAPDRYWTPFNKEGKKGDWWQVDLERTYPIYKVSVYSQVNNYHDWFSKFHINVSPDGTIWTTVVIEPNWDTSRNDEEMVSYVFKPIAARYLRIVSDIDQNHVGLQEIEVYQIKEEF